MQHIDKIREEFTENDANSLFPLWLTYLQSTVLDVLVYFGDLSND